MMCLFDGGGKECLFEPYKMCRLKRRKRKGGTGATVIANAISIVQSCLLPLLLPLLLLILCAASPPFSHLLLNIIDHHNIAFFPVAAAAAATTSTSFQQPSYRILQDLSCDFNVDTICAWSFSTGGGDEQSAVPHFEPLFNSSTINTNHRGRLNKSKEQKQGFYCLFC